jgi:hypothetical protein
MGVGKAPFAKFVTSILVGSLQVGRTGQARADDIAEVANHLHDLRMVQGDIADAVGRVTVDFLLRCGDARCKEKEQHRNAESGPQRAREWCLCVASDISSTPCLRISRKDEIAPRSVNQ